MNSEALERPAQPGITVVFLSSPGRPTRERQHYAAAFRRAGARVVEWLPSSITGGGLTQVAAQCGDNVLVLQPEQEPVLPSGLEEIPARTACFQIDTFRYTHRRIEWSMAFDHAFVFHPGFEGQFAAAGHPSATLLPHAVDPPSSPERLETRRYEVGWVGHFSGPLYSRRRRILPLLSDRFVMNTWHREYEEAAALSVYRNSKLVVNIGRDDWPQDANLRVFEAMASGALLVTSLPSELVELGFVPGDHFVGYTEDKGLESLVHDLLNDEPTLLKIAGAGRDMVLRHHTYDRRVGRLLKVVGETSGTRPRERSLTRERLQQIQLDYCLGHRYWRESLVVGATLAVRHPVSAGRVLRAVVGRRPRAGRSAVNLNS